MQPNGKNVHSFLLTCKIEVNAERIRSQGRLDLVKGGKGILLDVETLKEMRKKGELVRLDRPELLELDVTELLPEAAARRILEHVESVTRGKEKRKSR
jgi:hypothetical protein